VTKKGVVLSCLPLLLGCGTSELLIDVSGLEATIDQLDVYVVTQSSTPNVSKRISVSDVNATVKSSGGHYKLSLDHSLTLSAPGLAQIYVGALSGGCLRGVGIASGELRSNNDGFATLEVPVTPRMQANQKMPCAATNPVVTGIEISHQSAGPSMTTNEALIYGWGFTATSRVHVTIVPSRTTMIFDLVDIPLTNSEYLPDRLRLPLAGAPAATLASILSPDLPSISLFFDKKLRVINPGNPDIESADFSFK